MSAKYRERKAILVRRRFRDKIIALRPEDIGATRTRKNVRLRFERWVRPFVKATLFNWLGSEYADDPGIDAWLAIAINGEPVRDYVRRMYGANSDEEITRLANRVRKQKQRTGVKMQQALNQDRELGDQQAWPHDV